MTSEYRTAAGSSQKAYSKTAFFFILLFALIAVASVAWQAMTLIDTGIREPASIADLTGFSGVNLTGIAFIDQILFQLMSLHVGLLAIVMIVLVIVIDRLFKRA